MESVVTMRAVAERAGVSMATVSRALSGNRPMSATLRAHVLATAEDMGYRVNLLGRGLRQRRTSSVGLVVPDLDNPFFASLAQAVSRRFAALDVDLFVFSADSDVHNEARGVTSFLDRQVDALAIVPCDEHDSSQAVETAAARTVTIQLDRQTDTPAHFVGCDNAAGMALAAAHVQRVRRSGQPVVYVGGDPASSSERERRDGLLAALPDVAAVLEGRFNADWGGRAARKLIRAGLGTGIIVVGADVIAVGLMTGLDALSFRVPGDFRVVGFDGAGVTALAKPRLTTVEQPLGEMARRLAAIALAPPANGAAEVRVAPSFVARESSPEPRSSQQVDELKAIAHRDARRVLGDHGQRVGLGQ